MDARDASMISNDNSDVEALGAKIKRLRLERGLAQDRLAIEANVDQSGLSKFERGKQKNRFGPEPLTRIAKILGLTLPELTDRTDFASRDRVSD
jgi:transcriptional regulator with XRE-family HTH domain